MTEHIKQIAEILSRIAHDVARIAAAIERNDQHSRHAHTDWIAPDADARARLAGVPQPANRDPDDEYWVAFDPAHPPETEQRPTLYARVDDILHAAGYTPGIGPALRDYCERVTGCTWAPADMIDVRAGCAFAGLDNYRADTIVEALAGKDEVLKGL